MEKCSARPIETMVYQGRKEHSKSPMSDRRRHLGDRDAPEASKCIGVFGLSLYTTERELEKTFSK